ncbi:Ectonucleoside triphosphate diphosphohydrolase 5 [Dictyocoela muelleri]|nr:Ectonucleoside triphosphate diphosphohydrolase 5 [Dictyocoela muelleri]
MLFALFIFAKYVAVIDGGSTGTRLNIFEFMGKKLKNHFLVFSKPGLQDLDFKSINLKIKDLLLRGIEYLNSKNVDYENMSIGFYGTGGLRALDKRKSSKILKIVKDVFESFGFKPEVCLLKDVEEGRLALKTLDYLTEENNMKNGIIEMGGSSVQVAFKSDHCRFNIGEGNVCLLSYPDKGYIVKKFNNDISPITELNDHNLYLIAFFYDILKDIDGNCLNLNKIEQEINNKCTLNNTENCEGLKYIRNFLKSLGLKNDKQFRIANEINGINLNWALGKALEKIDI